MKTISPEKLAASLEGNSPPAIVDVRLADDFAAMHLQKAVSNCVYEVSFHERLPETLPDKDKPVVVYGAAANSEEGRMAVEKLIRHGYVDVALLEGGIAAWKKAGLPVILGDPIPDAPSVPDGRFPLDLEESRLEWKGRNLINSHYGTIDIKAGYLDFSAGSLTGGLIEFDLNSLKCTDLEGDPLHAVLIGHLMDHDFLDVNAHPECHLAITGSEYSEVPGSQNLKVHADLTMRGQTHPIEFTAAAGITPEGQAAAQAGFAIDRTKWGILYGSGRFFQRLAGHLVNDLIEFQAKIIAKAS